MEEPPADIRLIRCHRDEALQLVGGWAAGRRARIVDGKFEDLGCNVPHQKDRVKRLVNARLQLLFQTELGDLPSAKAALGTVMSLLDALEQESGPPTPETVSGAEHGRKKPA